MDEGEKVRDERNQSGCLNRIDSICPYKSHLMPLDVDNDGALSVFVKTPLN